MSSDGDTTKNPLQQLSDHPLGTIVNGIVNYATGGIAGVNDKGKLDLKAGGMTRAATESVGEVTGTNAAREATNQAAHQAELERAARATDLTNRQSQNQQDDINASNQVAALHATAGSKANPTLRYNQLGNPDQRDFLGL